MKNNDKARLKRKAKLANVIANASNALINWQPFNMRPMRAMYRWANTVRANDPAWIDYLKQQESEALAEAEAKEKKAQEKAAKKAAKNGHKGEVPTGTFGPEAQPAS